MLSCKEVVKIVSSEDRPTWRRKLEIRLHLMMCHHCGKYAKQLEMMKAGFRKLFSSASKISDDKKIRELEDRVIEKAKRS